MCIYVCSVCGVIDEPVNQVTKHCILINSIAETAK